MDRHRVRPLQAEVMSLTSSQSIHVSPAVSEELTLIYLQVLLYGLVARIMFHIAAPLSKESVKRLLDELAHSRSALPHYVHSVIEHIVQSVGAPTSGQHTAEWLEYNLTVSVTAMILSGLIILERSREVFALSARRESDIVQPPYEQPFLVSLVISIPIDAEPEVVSVLVHFPIVHLYVQSFFYLPQSFSVFRTVGVIQALSNRASCVVDCILFGFLGQLVNRVNFNNHFFHNKKLLYG